MTIFVCDRRQISGVLDMLTEEKFREKMSSRLLCNTNIDINVQIPYI